MEWVQGTLATLSSLGSIYGGWKAGKEAKAAANKQARMEGEVTIAKLEDLLSEERVLKGQTVAAAAGAGVKVGVGSPLEIYAEQARSFERERDIVARVGATKASVISQRGRMVGRQATYQGFTQGAAGLANAFTMFPKYLGKQPGPG